MQVHLHRSATDTATNVKVGIMKRLSLIPILFITASLAACSGTSPEEKQSAAVNDVGSTAETSKNKPSPSAPRNDSKGSASPEPTQPEASNKNQQSTPPQSKRMRSGSEKTNSIRSS